MRSLVLCTATTLALALALALAPASLAQSSSNLLQNPGAEAAPGATGNATQAPPS